MDGCKLFSDNIWTLINGSLTVKQEDSEGFECDPREDYQSALTLFWSEENTLYMPPNGFLGERSWSWDDVVKVQKSERILGCCAEVDIRLVVQLADGRWVYAWASCDTSGWGCETYGKVYMAQSLEDLEKYAMGVEEMFNVQ